ncbi:acyltransferase family protein [Burkholderia ubonensis]|uniref:acyltransferase family protein n=1 Tax=Burkholderia ubonensis TaxID=101571 RepID=UPI0007538C7C|nr:acyltransferase [Burkholderia ubonensis]KVA29318.1 acyltransferase [Burkholderia ubonensis]KVA30357.1 acyltransferase [Burkholderia ubonensis]KVA53638.1 acyltransferase [Burkholderia ubonensis]
MTHRVQQLTGLRAVAVAMVVVGHAEHVTPGGYTGWLAPLRLLADGRLGVLIFFVLSGFLITNVLLGELKRTGSIALAPFYVRRVLRIWPACYAYLAVVALLAVAGWVDVSPRQWALAALHLWNYSVGLGLTADTALHPDGAWYLGHFWSLALEEQFYWFWPLLLLFAVRRTNTRWLAALILIVPLVRAGTYFAAPALRGQLRMMFHTGIDPILIGCYVALNRQRLEAWIGSWRGESRIVTAIVCIVLFAMPVIESELRGIWNITYGVTIEAALIGVLIVVLNFRNDLWCSRLLQTRPMVFIGTISFSLYLWQQPFANPNLPIPHGFPLGILEAFAAATASYFLIEKPFLRLKDRYSARGAQRARDGGLRMPAGTDAIGPKVAE